MHREAGFTPGGGIPRIRCVHSHAAGHLARDFARHQVTKLIMGHQ
jgi:hypothetical protein